MVHASVVGSLSTLSSRTYLILITAWQLYRCFVLWAWQKRVVIPMTTIFAAMVGTYLSPSPVSDTLKLIRYVIAMSILVLAEASGAVFYNINFELAYLCLQVGLTLIYTLLVACRLLSLRKKAIGSEDVSLYGSTATMVVESAALYAPVGIIFIVSFAVHSDVTNLVFLSVSHVQVSARCIVPLDGRSSFFFVV